jgi:hypothetical protein
VFVEDDISGRESCKDKWIMSYQRNSSSMSTQNNYNGDLKIKRNVIALSKKELRLMKIVSL